MRRVATVLGLVLIPAAAIMAAVSMTAGDFTLYRSSAKVEVYPTLKACQDAALANAKQFERTKTSGTTAYSCRQSLTARYSAGPPPPITGSASIAWTPPTTNSDGTPITALSGYEILYGPSPTSLGVVVNVSSPGATSHVVNNLTAGTWYFAVRAVNAAGARSQVSNVASKVIR